MKVIEETRSKLVLQEGDENPTLAAFFSSIFIGIVLLMVGFFSDYFGVTTFECQRVEPTLINCSKSKSKLLGLKQQPASSLRNVKKAEYNSKTYKNSEGNTYTEYWVSVIAEGVEISVFRGNPAQMIAIATKINRFINSNEPLLIVRQDELLIVWQDQQMLFILSSYIAFAIIILNIYVWNVALQMKTFTFDKNSQNLRYKKKNLFGTKSRCHQFGNISKVEIEEYLDDDDDKHYKLSLLLPSASKNYVLMYSCEKGEMEKMAQKLSDLSGIPVSHKFPEKT